MDPCPARLCSNRPSIVTRPSITALLWPRFALILSKGQARNPRLRFGSVITSPSMTALLLSPALEFPPFYYHQTFYYRPCIITRPSMASYSITAPRPSFIVRASANLTCLPWARVPLFCHPPFYNRAPPLYYRQGKCEPQVSALGPCPARL